METERLHNWLWITDDKGMIREELVEAKFNGNSQWEIGIKGILDKEEGVDKFEAMIKLKTQSAFANPPRMISMVKIE